MRRSIKNLYSLARNDEERQQVDDIKYLRKWTRIHAIGSTVTAALGTGAMFGIDRWRNTTESLISRGIAADLGQFVCIAGGLTLSVFITFGSSDMIDSFKMTNEYLKEHKEAEKALKLVR